MRNISKTRKFFVVEAKGHCIYEQIDIANKFLKNLPPQVLGLRGIKVFFYDTHAPHEKICSVMLSPCREEVTNHKWMKLPTEEQQKQIKRAFSEVPPNMFPLMQPCTESRIGELRYTPTYI